MKTSISKSLQMAMVGALLLSLASISTTAAEPKPKGKRPPEPAVMQPDEEAMPVNMADSVKAERQVAKKPHDRKARLAAARAQLAEGAESRSRVEAAQEHVAAVLEDNPNDVEALVLAGQTSLLKNDAMNAARYYRAAVNADANNATACLGLGDTLTRLGDEPGATAAFARYRALMGMPPLPTSSAR